MVVSMVPGKLPNSILFRPTALAGCMGVTDDIHTYRYTVSQKNDTDVTHYRFNPHQPISVVFGRDVAERVCY